MAGLGAGRSLCLVSVGRRLAVKLGSRSCNEPGARTTKLSDRLHMQAVEIISETNMF